MNPRIRFGLKTIAVTLVALLLLEGALRLLLGFGHLPVYYTSPAYEYALQPKQELTRFGHRFFVNAEGMRSAPLKEGESRLIKFGDSVLNGGVRIGNDSLCSSILERALQKTNPTARALNVSAGSWGPDNAYAWMQDHGDFNAWGIVLVFSSHDWTDTMTFRDVVGHVPFYPGHQPTTAIGDAWTWFSSRYLEKTNWAALPILPHDTMPANGDHDLGWDRFYQYSRRENKPLLVYHHATRAELNAGKWNSKGQALEAFLKERNIPVVSGFDVHYKPRDYLDNIHLASSGHRKLAEALYGPIRNMHHD